MKKHINYYYYYYAGANLPFMEPKAYDIYECNKFIKKSSTLLQQISESDDFLKSIKRNYSGKFNNVNNLGNNYDFSKKFHEYVEDVMIVVNSEIRDISHILLDQKSINDYWERLKQVGMTGIQLEVKLNMWYAGLEKIKTFINNGVNYLVDNTKELLNFLSLTNAIFGSLFKVFLNLDILEELKKMIEFIINE